MMAYRLAAVFALLFCASVVCAQTNEADSFPLVSVVVPTFERPLFVQHMLELVFKQDYPNLEVIIVDDSPSPSLVDVPERVQYVHLPNQRLSIGEKRNIGAALAKGQVIVHWDDDDYFRSHRISAQVAPILAGEADMTVLEHHIYMFAKTREYFTVRRSSSWGPHFGTFTYSRKLWDSGLRYPHNSMAEDYAFAEQGLNNGFTIQTLGNEDGKHIYVRHSNTWEIDFAEYQAQVEKISRPEFFTQQEEDFYHDAAVATYRSSNPPNMYPSELIQWDRRELAPSWDDAAYMADEVGATPKYPKYPNYLKGEVPGHGGLPISWGVTAVIVLVILAGVIAVVWRERRSLRYTTVGDDRQGSGFNLEDRKGKGRGYGSV